MKVQRITHLRLVQLTILIKRCHILGEEHITQRVDGLNARREDVFRRLRVVNFRHLRSHLNPYLFKLRRVFGKLQLQQHRLVERRVCLLHRLQRRVHVVHHHHHDFALVGLFLVVVNDGRHTKRESDGNRSGQKRQQEILKERLFAAALLTLWSM